MTDKTVKALISGRVQGVAFRAWTRDVARQRGLSGWVRNLPDGRVEALFAGPVEAVDAVLEECRKGPPAARVDRIETQDMSAISATGFEVRH